MNYIHIGLPKTGTTFLQKDLFPKICNLLKLDFYINSNKILENENIKNFFLLSNENLVTPDPKNATNPFQAESWKLGAEKNLEKFKKETSIIITIRNVHDLFSSIYCQSFKAYKIKEENDFFLNQAESKKKNTYDDYFINYENFSYENLIRLYSDNFENVYVIKYEDIKNLDLWSKIFKNKEITKIKYSNKIFNKSYNKKSMKLTLFIEKLLRKFNTNLYNLYLKSNSIKNISFLTKRLKERISLELRWDFFIQYRFEKIFSDQKYIIENKKLKNYIEENYVSFYNDFRSCYINKSKKIDLI